MRSAAAFILICGVAAGQEPSRPSPIVVLPSAIRDSMSAIWVANNRHWDWVPDANTPVEMQGSPAPTRRHFGCLLGVAAGDTLWIRQLAPATGVKQRQREVSGDCSNAVGLIGTWHTHPYRAGFERRAIKERGLSGPDLRAFAATSDLITIAVWDVDSLDLAAKGSEGALRYPASCIIR